MTTVTEIMKHKGELFVNGKLKLVGISGINQWVATDGRIVSPIIVSDSEGFIVNDLVWNQFENRIEFAKDGQCFPHLQKVLALPENFPPDKILDIKDGKLKDGDAVYLACKNESNVNDEPVYKIKLKDKIITILTNMKADVSPAKERPFAPRGSSVPKDIKDEVVISKEEKIQNTKLHKDLIPYLETSKSFPMLRHPIVYSIPHYSSMNEFINKQYEYKKKAIEQAKLDCNYSAYVFLHERPHRLNAFSDIGEWLSDADFYSLLSDIWVDSENISQQKELWWDCLTDRFAMKRHFMNDEEKKVFNELPEKVKVYRGYIPSQSNQTKFGFSYTLDKKKAEWFAKRFNANGKVWSRVVSKDEIFAYIDRRGEKEIIITTKEKYYKHK